jgi:myo-inositol 2-dehydrogenase / D-chiro-inositol 1-dehydrogenase
MYRSSDKIREGKDKQMMDIAVGVIGAGVMGSAHAQLFARQIKGARLISVADRNLQAAEAAASRGRAVRDGEELIADPAVEAVVIASPDQTHFGLVRACLEAGKPVLCEKPLAMTAEEALKLVALEAEIAKASVHVGFMRRFDAAYRALRETISSGKIGVPRLVHNRHRNVAAPAWFTADMALSNSAVHEFDICRWLLGTDYTTGHITIAPQSEDLTAGDPLLITCDTETGALVSIEVFMNARYGYDVRCEVVGSAGATDMAHPALTRVRHEGSEHGDFAANWVPRFAEAYRLQNQAWVDGLTRDVPHEAATAWDGFVATWIAEAFINRTEPQAMVDLRLPARPQTRVK